MIGNIYLLPNEAIMDAGCYWIRVDAERWVAAELTTEEGLPPLGANERVLRGSATDLFRAAHNAGKSVWLLGRLLPQQLPQAHERKPDAGQGAVADKKEAA